MLHNVVGKGSKWAGSMGLRHTATGTGAKWKGRLAAPPVQGPKHQPSYEPKSHFNTLGGAGMVGMALGGAVAGGTASYATGGGFWQGAAAGLMVGGGAAAAMRPAGAAFLSRTPAAGMDRTLRGLSHEHLGPNFTQGMTKAARFTQDTGSRRMAFGAGALLGGTLFGGNRSRARGFNSNRGNRFGR